MANKRVILEPLNPPLKGTDATILLTVSGMKNLTHVSLELHEKVFKHDDSPDTDTVVGKLKGLVVSAGRLGYTLALDTDGVEKDVPQPDKDAPKDPETRIVAVVMAKGNNPVFKFFKIKAPPGALQRKWVIQAKMTEPEESVSNPVTMGVAPFALEVENQATYDWHSHNEVKLYAHGADEPATDDHGAAFTDMVAAINDAQHFVFITDWSFQPYFRVVRQPGANLPIGRLLLDAAKRGVLVGIIAWKHPPIGAADEHNNEAQARFRALNGNAKLPDTLLWRAAQRTTTYSHHQKFVVLDAKVPGEDRRVIKAFFGGLDLTKGRWDGSAHVIDPDGKGPPFDDFKRQQVVPVPGTFSDSQLTYDDWYSAEFQSDSESDRTMPRQPWHDIYGCVTGPTAWDIIREWVGRWNDFTQMGSGDQATRFTMDQDRYSGPPTEKTKLVNNLYDALHDDKKFVQQNQVPKSAKGASSKNRWACQLLRSMTGTYWATDRLGKKYEHDFKWTLAKPFERSIQDAYLNAISLAEEYVYIETQYFISSGNDWATTRWGVKNAVASALCDRIKDRHSKGKPFHVYVICPMYPEGPPLAGTGVPQMQRHFEWETMQFMAGRISKECGGDWKKYVSFYFPAKNGAPKRGQLMSPKGYWFVNKDGSRTYADPNQQYVTAPNPKTAKITRKELVKANNRYMVYVHSKLMMVDDTYVILGSANLNERSLAGDRDTEICVHMWPGSADVAEDCKKQLKGFRDHLFTEHFGSTGDAKSFGPSALAAAGANYKMYALGQTLTAGKCLTLPLKLTWESHLIGDDTPLLRLDPLPGVPEWSNEFLFDAEEETDWWRWWSDKAWGHPAAGWMDLAE